MRRSYFQIVVFSLLVFVGFLFRNAYAENVNPHGKIRWACDACHSAKSWHQLKFPLDFDHKETGYLLVGSHQNVKCRDCHLSMMFPQVGTNCADCHTDVHRAQLGFDCQNCHTPRNWESKEETFQFHAERGFPLTGVHAGADCEACHLGQQSREFSGTPIECSGCHLNNFVSAEDPNHEKANFATDCQECHISAAPGWRNTRFDHAQFFPLRGAHTSTRCAACHAGSFAGTRSECVACHEADFQRTVSPSHRLFGFPTECAVCHGETNWSSASFQHTSVTDFPLLGAHGQIRCTDCHTNNQLTGLARDCFGCHQFDYRQVKSPDHQAGNFPQDCAVCHTQAAWKPALFDHNISGFPLTGAHATAACESCHASGYSGTPTACFSCHESDYNGTNDPAHQAAGFPTDCEGCHNSANWNQTTWDHDGQYFPVYSGKHKGKWNVCADCHVNPSTFQAFECIVCHEHSQTKMDEKHQGVSGYAYQSSACYDCHPTGEE